MQPKIAIFCAFSRRWAIDTWLEHFNKVEFNPERTSLCAIIDCEEMYIVNQLKTMAAERGIELHYRVNEDWSPNETKLRIRRLRVAELHTQSKELIAKTDAEIVIGLEDDTILANLKSFYPLYSPMKNNREIGFVEGVQMGRWGANIIGAWKANNPSRPTEIHTMLPHPQLAYQEISAGGFYGYATRRELYMAHEYFTSVDQPWGPDVNYGLWLGQQGYKCFINWELEFGHNDHGQIAYPSEPPKNERLVSVIYNKDELTGKWNRTDHEPTRY